MNKRNNITSIYSKNNVGSDIFKDIDILSFTKTSYDGFLQQDLKQSERKNIGLNYIFNSFFSYLNQFIFKTKDFFLKYKGYEVFEENPELNQAFCVQNKQTLNYIVNLKVDLCFKKQKKFFEFKFMMFKIPKLTSQCNFLINGCYRSIVSRLVSNNGVLLTHDAVRNTTKLIIRPSSGTTIHLYYQENKILFNVYKTFISLDCFLLIFGFFKNIEEIVNFYFEHKIISIKDIMIGFDKKNFILLSKEEASLFLNKNRFLDLSDRRNENILKQLFDYWKNKKISKIKIYSTSSLEKEIIFNSLSREEIKIEEESKRLFRIGHKFLYKESQELLNKESEYNKKLKQRFFDNFFYYFDDAAVFNMNQLFDTKITSHCLNFKIFNSALFYYLKYIKVYKNQLIDINSLENKRIINVGEYLYDIVHQIFYRLRYYNTKKLLELNSILKQKITTDNTRSKYDASRKIINNFLNTNFFQSYIDKFFNRDFRSQFEDQLNLLSELNHRRKILLTNKDKTSNNKKTSFIRSIHSSYAGKICSILTSEGQKIGLAVMPTLLVKINKYGVLQVPYFKVNKGKIDVSKVVYLNNEKEYNSYITNYDKTIKNNEITKSIIICKYRGGFVYQPKTKVQYIYIHNLSTFSAEASLIPFAENTATTRLMTGCNMYKQSTFLLKPEVPNVMSGAENFISKYDDNNVKSKSSGTVKYVDSLKIIIKDNKNQEIIHNLNTISSNNKNTMSASWPVVEKGQKVSKDQIIASNINIINGKYLSLGVNLKIAYMPKGLFTYEDGIVISDRLIKERIFTDVKIKEYTLECKNLDDYAERFTNMLPKTSVNILSKLDENGLIKIGSLVQKGDIIIGRLSPARKNSMKSGDEFINSFIGKKKTEYKNTSLYYNENFEGIVMNVYFLKKKSEDNHISAVVKILSLHDVETGDKTSARYGNKGVITQILKQEDMPFIAQTGETIDIMISPESIPSRMNIGQLFESALGRVSYLLSDKKNKKCFVSQPFSGFDHRELEEILQKQYKKEPNSYSKFLLRDGKTGEMYSKPVTVGSSYFFKLNHNVDDKINSRSTGYYSLITMQPPSGKINQGAQKVGEMENWAFEAYGAANYQHSILNWRSDNVFLRNKVYNDIVKKGFFEPDKDLSFGDTLTESTKYFLNIIFSMGLGVKILDKNGEELFIDKTLNKKHKPL